MQMPLKSLSPAPIRDPVRLNKTRRLGLYGVGAGLWLSGGLWVIFHYFMMQKTAFGPSPHPLEHWWLSLHGLFAFATLWMLGLLWGAHIVGGWRSGRRRITGSVLALVLLELTATGYLLYYPPNDDWLPPLAWAHWAVGLMLPVLFVLHRLWRPKRGADPVLLG